MIPKYLLNKKEISVAYFYCLPVQSMFYELFENW